MVTRIVCIAAAVGTLAGFAGCYTEHFTYLSSSAGHLGSYECHILSGYGSVEYSGDSIVLHRGARMTARHLYQTFNEGFCFVRVATGNAVRIRLRSGDLGDSLLPGMSLLLGKDKSFIQDDSRPAMPIAPVLKEGMTRVGFQSEAGTMTIVVDCDTVFQGKTALPATDVLAFESVDGSEVVIRGLEAQSLRNGQATSDDTAQEP